MLSRRTLMLSVLATPVRAAQAPVVLELFTSQGCSSCPPADALLGTLSERAEVVALAFHVDYWNRLGWPDPFADRRWTERQRVYARLLGAEVYTPALVVGGARMVVGSDARSVQDAIGAVAPPRMAAGLSRTGAGVVAAYQSGAASAVAVLYDARHETRVRGGENGGRVLREYQVVRDVIPLDPGQGRAELPSPGPGQGMALLMQAANGRIDGAAILRPGETSTGSRPGSS